MICIEDESQGSLDGALYTPSRFTIQFPTGMAKINTDNRRLEFNTDAGLARAWHEYSHFIQAVSTPSGISEIIYRFELIVEIGKSWKEFRSIRPNFETIEPISDAVKRIKEFSAWTAHRARVEGDSVREAPKGQLDFELWDGEEFSGIPSKWICIPKSGGHSRIVRLTRSFFNEAMAQAIEEATGGAFIPFNQRTDNEKIHYFALSSYLSHWLPEIDNTVATVIVAGACMMAPVPMEVFLGIHRSIHSSDAKAVLSDLIRAGETVRIASLCFLEFSADVRYVQEHLNERFTYFNNAKTPQPSYYIARLLEFMMSRWQRHFQNLGDFLRPLFGKSAEDFYRIQVAYGAPLIQYQGQLLYFGVNDDLRKAWRTFAISSAITERMMSPDSSAQPCFLSSFSNGCNHPRKGTGCNGNFVQYSMETPATKCEVAEVADSMGLSF